LKTDVYLSFYDDRNACPKIHKIIQLLTWSNISHVALIFNFKTVAITPMVLVKYNTTKIYTEKFLNSHSKLKYKFYMGSVDITMDNVLNLCLTHKVSSVSKEIFMFTIGWLFGLKASNCCTLAVDFLNNKMNYNFKNRNNPNKLMKEVYYDCYNDCGTSKGR